MSIESDLLTEIRLLRAAIETLTTQLRAGAPASQVPASPLRNVYTTEQFAAEILGGNRTKDWVQGECRGRRIKTVSRRPFLIPQSEAVRFSGSSAGVALYQSR